MPGVEFCRVNRRTLDRSLDIRPFVDDMRALADSGETTAKVAGVTYRAADLKVNPSGTYMTGLIGFVEKDTVRHFEPDAFSWVKGEVLDIEGATNQMVVPFAIDLRTHRRWVAYVVSSRIRSNVFRSALAATLNAAVNALGLLPSEWEVDPVLSVSTVEEWIAEHPEVMSFTRKVKVTNVLKDVDDARRKMRELGATRMTDTWTAGRGDVLDLRDNEEFDDMIGGVETGDVELVLEARVGKAKLRFRSSEHTDKTIISEYGSDLERGVELVLDALRQFSDRRGEVVLGDREAAESEPDEADTVEVQPTQDDGEHPTDG